MEQRKAKKTLLIGIVVAALILIAAVGILLMQDLGAEQAATAATAAPEPPCQLYWNLDRAEYDAKSEAGMSSRKPQSDGYFHVRFFISGEIVELKVKDRKVINAIDVNDLMGLEFDDECIVVAVTHRKEMPCRQIAWKYYVQSFEGGLLKLNSSPKFNGLEQQLAVPEGLPIYDVTGKEDAIGMDITPATGDKIIVIGNMDGEPTHIFVCRRGS